MKTIQSAGGVIINDNKECVVVAQSRAGSTSSSWSLPKGKVEEGEDYLTAAKREIYEETGLTEIELVKEFPAYSRPRMVDAQGTESEDLIKTLHFFLFKTAQKELKPIDPDNPEARWVSYNSAVELLTNDRDREFLRKVLSEI